MTRYNLNDLKLFWTYYASKYLIHSPKVQRRKSRNGRGSIMSWNSRICKRGQKGRQTIVRGTAVKGSCWKIYIYSFMANLDYWKKRDCEVNFRESNSSSSSIRPLETVATVWYLFSQLKAWTIEEPLHGKTSLLQAIITKDIPLHYNNIL